MRWREDYSGMFQLGGKRGGLQYNLVATELPTLRVKTNVKCCHTGGTSEYYTNIGILH